MADLKEVRRCGIISLNTTELALIITALRIAKESTGLEGKRPVTIDGLRQDLIDCYEKVSGEYWKE